MLLYFDPQEVTIIKIIIFNSRHMLHQVYMIFYILHPKDILTYIIHNFLFENTHD
jgi:hypothetical protein